MENENTEAQGGAPENQTATSENQPETQASTPESITAYPDHEYAGIFPMMAEGDDYNQFKEDLRQFGQKEVCVLLDEKILDGRNRQKALIELGIAPNYRQFDPATEGDPLDFVLAHNLHRRHLSPGQRAAIATDFEEIFAAEAKARRQRGTPVPATGGPGYDKEEDEHATGDTSADTSTGETQNVDTSGEFNQAPPGDGDTAQGKTSKNGTGKDDQATRSSTKAAKTMGVSPRAVREAKKLKKNDPAAFKDVKEGRKSLNAAATGKATTGSKASEDYEAAIARIEKVCGKPLANAIRDGSRLKKRGDVVAYAGLKDEQMLATRHQIEHGWSLKKALLYKAEDILPTHRVIDAINRASAEGKKGFKQLVLTPEIGCDWQLTLTPVERPKIKDVIAQAKVGDVIVDPNVNVKKRGRGRPSNKDKAAAPAPAKKAPAKKKVGKLKSATPIPHDPTLRNAGGAPKRNRSKKATG